MLRFVLYFMGALVLLVAGYVFVFSGSFHQPTDRFMPAAGAGPSGPVLIFGGNRGTGLEIVRQLKARGEDVTVAVRANADTSALRALAVRTVVADALQPAQVQAAFTAAPYRAVISTLGSSRPGEVRPDFDGNRNVIDAARTAGARRFVLITVIGTGNSRETTPLLVRGALKNVIDLKDRAEQHLKASGLDYTIIRPGGLGNGRPTGQAYLTEDPQAFSYIARADLAALVVQALGSPNAVGRTFSAYDPARRTLWGMFAD